MRLANDANASILEWLQGQAEQPTRRLRARRRVLQTQLRCDVELCERLDAIAHGLPVQLRYVAELPILVHPNRVILAVAAGATWCAMRLPLHVHSAVAHSEWGRRGLKDDWIDVDPWLSELAAPEGLSRMQGLCRAAFEHAGTLRS